MAPGAARCHPVEAIVIVIIIIIIVTIITVIGCGVGEVVSAELTTKSGGASFQPVLDAIAAALSARAVVSSFRCWCLSPHAEAL